MIQSAKAKQPNTIKKVLVYIVQIVIVGLLSWFLYQNRDLFALLQNVRWQHILGIVILDTLIYVANSYINYSMLTRLDPKVTFTDSLMLQYVNSLLNKILPTIGGGAAFRAYYLKKKYQFPYTQFASTVTGLYVVSFSTTSIIGILCLIIIYLEYQVFNWLIFMAFVGILIFTLAVILFPVKVPASSHRLLRILKNTVDSWNIIKREPKIVLGYMILTLIILLLSTAYTYLGYSALGVEPSLIPMVYLSTLGIIMAFLNFTPDGIGVKEGIYVFSQNLVRIPQDVLVLGSLYLRGISIVTTIVIGAISYWILLRRLRDVEGNQIPVTEHE